MASRDEIDRVRTAVNILDVVAPYVALKRAGSVWKGLCPFHSEKTPSFQINPDKGAWYCFGCSEGGDVFKFIERIENLGFNDALERLAGIAGIALSEKRESPAELSHREQMYMALEAAASFYEQTLSRSAIATQYLLDRGVTREYQLSFRLGYAGDTFDALGEYLRSRHVDIAVAVEAGVLTRSDRQNSAPYDKLRGRIVCPILDAHDRPIAFGGRLMETIEDRPKYLNTAETPLFSKGKTFYALSRARKAIADLQCVVVVEGYFDVISAHQAGFNNVVATLGTALTPAHADILSRYVGRANIGQSLPSGWAAADDLNPGRDASRVVLAFDADAAGAKAALRANAIFESKGFDVQVMELPPGEDPDSLLRAGRTAEFRRAIDDAAPIREFQLKTLCSLHLRKPDLSERDKTAIFRREIVPVLRSTKSPIEQERYIRIAAELHPTYKIGAAYAEDQIRQEVRGSEPHATGTGGYPGSVPTRGGWTRRWSGGATNAVASPNSAPQRGLLAAEENLLRALIGNEDSNISIIREHGVTQDLFVTPACRELARRMLSTDTPDPALRRDTWSSGDDNADIDPELNRLRARLMAEGDDATNAFSQAPVTAELIADCIRRLEREKIDRLEEQLRSRVDAGDPEALREFMQLHRKMHEK